MAKEYYEFDTDTEEIKPTKMAGLRASVKEKTSKIDKWKLFKNIAGMAASGCASVVMHKYLKTNMPEPQNAFETAVTGVGVYFITGIVGSKVAKYAEQELDEWRDSIMEIREGAVAEMEGEE